MTAELNESIDSLCIENEGLVCQEIVPTHSITQSKTANCSFSLKLNTTAKVLVGGVFLNLSARLTVSFQLV